MVLHGGFSVLMPRFFIAIEFSDELKQKFGALRVPISGARWVSKEQIHLTLAFLGEVDEEVVPCLIDSLAVLHSPPFKLRYLGTGCFPDRRRPHVLWTGFEPQPLLSALVDKIRAAVATCHIALESRPFVPHVTLARLKSPAMVEVDSFLCRSHEISLPPVEVKEFILFESRLTSHGAIHSPVGTFPLKP